MAEFYRGARIFDTQHYDISHTYDEELVLIEKCGTITYSCGEDTMIDKLKRSWKVYCQNASHIASAFDISQDKFFGIIS